MRKAILLIDVEQVKDKCICFDEDYTCPIFNKDKWKCQYRINTKAEDCPLRPLPTKMSATANANLDLICNMSREENKIYNVGYTQGRNNCIDEILGEEEE